MAFRYRLQKILDFRIKKKEAQMMVVQKAQAEVIRIEQMIARNAAEIMSTRENMRKADFSMLEAYDRYLKSLYDKETQLLQEKKEAVPVAGFAKKRTLIIGAIVVGLSLTAAGIAIPVAISASKKPSNTTIIYNNGSQVTSQFIPVTSATLLPEASAKRKCRRAARHPAAGWCRCSS